MTNQEFNQLLGDALKRTVKEQEIEKTVIKELKERERNRRWLVWGRILAFCFGLPLVWAFYLWVMIHLVRTHLFNPYLLACMSLPTIALLIISCDVIKNFDPKKVS